MTTKGRPKCFCINKSYEVTDIVLGRGSFSTVYLARHLIFGNKVALKVINRFNIEEEYVLRNLHREANLLKKLNHPNIVNFYEELSQKELYCLSMEYIRGMDLSSYLRKQQYYRVSEIIAKTLFYQMVSAVEHMHRNNILHRDLKQENILLENGKVIKIVDFGLSNIYQPKIRLRTHCGSMVYAAPELFQNRSVYGAGVDLWSLGVILYAMVIGRMPFEIPKNSNGSSTSIQRKEMFFKRISEGLKQKNWDHMRILSKDCCHLLKNLLQPDQFKRMQIKTAASHPWFQKDSELVLRLPDSRRDLKDKFTPEIINLMAAKMCVSRHRVRNHIRSYKFDKISAIFYILRDTLIKDVLYPPKDLKCSFLIKFRKWQKFLNSEEQEDIKSSTVNSECVRKFAESTNPVESKSSTLSSSCRCSTVSTKHDFNKKKILKKETDNSKPSQLLLDSAKETTNYVSNSTEQTSRPVKSYKNSRPCKAIPPNIIAKNGEKDTKNNNFLDSSVVDLTSDKKFTLLKKESGVHKISERFESKNVPERVECFQNETCKNQREKKYPLKSESLFSKPVSFDSKLSGLQHNKPYETIPFSVSEDKRSCGFYSSITSKTILQKGAKYTENNNDFSKTSNVGSPLEDEFSSVNRNSSVHKTKRLESKNTFKNESVELITSEKNRNQSSNKCSLKSESFVAKPSNFDLRHPKLLLNKSLETSSVVSIEDNCQTYKFNPSRNSTYAKPSVSNYYSLNPKARPPSKHPSQELHGNPTTREFSIQETKPNEAYFNRNILISRADRGYGRTFFNSNIPTRSFRNTNNVNVERRQQSLL